MIKKLRFRFVIASMLSILFVLAATIGSINIANYVRARREIDSSLDTILVEGPEPNNSQPDPNGPPSRPEDMQREHYFIVVFDEGGAVTESDFTHIFVIGEAEGTALASSALAAGSEKGRVDNFFYKKAARDSGTVIAFLDAKERRDSCRGFLRSSAIIASVSYVVLFGLILLSSKLVFRVNEESYKKQKAFITNASHELKTPLTIISTDADILEMDHGKNEWTDSIHDQVARLTAMTNELVTLSRLDEGDPASYPFAPIAFSNLVVQTVDDFAPSFAQRKLNLETDIEKDVEIVGNEGLLEKLVAIFLDNALKYAAEGPVSVTLRKTKKGAALTFENAIDPANELDVNQVFERFYRSPTNKKEGSGIGLSIAKEIVSRHKGTLKAERRENRLIFSITL